MPTVTSLKNRIKTITNSQHITKAMNLVANAKLQKIRSLIKPSRDFFHELDNIKNNITI